MTTSKRWIGWWLMVVMIAPAIARSESASEQLAAAKEQVQSGAYDQAEVALMPLLAGESKVAASIALGRCYLETGRYEAAKTALESVKDESRSNVDWHIWSARLAETLGDYEGAIESARHAMGIDRNSCVARLLLAQNLEIVGKSQEALQEYEWFDRLVKHRLPIDPDNLVAAGAGFYRYSVLTQNSNLVQRTRHVLQKMYQKAYQMLDPKYWPAHLAVADLLAEKFSLDEAADDYRAVLNINTNAVAAHVGLGWIARDQWRFEDVDRHAQDALDINTNSVDALVLLAASRMLERRYTLADGFAQRALAINPNSIDALAYATSAKLALFDEAAADVYVKRADAINPKSGRFHEIVAQTLSDRRQYPQSEVAFLKAIEYEPSSAMARAELGMLYMQWGDEEKARVHLDAAWEIDAFNARTKYSLDLLDKLVAYARLETEHFDVRCEKGLDEVIAASSAKYLESIYDEICKRFDLTLDRRTIVEIFPAHDDFGVRVTGQPWINTGGACTGWVIGVIAPRFGMGKSPFHLPSVLRHEFVHTVTLAATNNRIPHWMTEGLAVLHEDEPRSFGWKEDLAERIRNDDLAPLNEVDWGFMRPKRPNDRAMAYAQSEWMCEFLMDRFGDGVINAMLRDSREGMSQTGLFAKHAKMTPEEFDDAFRAWAIEQATPWGFDLTPPENVETLKALALETPDDASVLARLAMACMEAGDIDEAMTHANASLAIDAKDNALAHEVLMRVYAGKLHHAEDAEQSKEWQQAGIDHAREVLIANPKHRKARMVIAKYHLAEKKDDAALPHLLDLMELYPVDPMEPYELARIYTSMGDDERALPMWKACRQEFSNNREIPAAIAAIHRRAGRLAEACDWYERALQIDPLSPGIGEAYANVLMQMGRTDDAIARYQLLCRIDPEEARFQTACALALFKAGNESEAINYAKRAVALDPKSDARSLLD
ncbi:MAG TPA: tetratricopeptide repeat protein [Phycisphaerae bacterium]|nr:tetratricopeptide repeat protein [Phycisphaerae bacterium]